MNGRTSHPFGCLHRAGPRSGRRVAAICTIIGASLFGDLGTLRPVIAYAAQCSTAVPDPQAYLRKELARLSDVVIGETLEVTYGGVRYFDVVSILVASEQVYACLRERDYVRAFEAAAVVSAKTALKDALRDTGLPTVSTVAALAAAPIVYALQLTARQVVQGALEFNFKVYAQARRGGISHDQIIASRDNDYQGLMFENGWLWPLEPRTWGGARAKPVPIPGIKAREVYELAKLVYEGRVSFDAEKKRVLTSAAREASKSTSSASKEQPPSVQTSVLPPNAVRTEEAIAEYRQSLSLRGRDSTPLLWSIGKNALRDTDVRIRVGAASALGELARESESTVTRALRDTVLWDLDPTVRALCLEALAKRRTAEGATVLRQALADPDERVRSAALLGLGKHGNPSDLPSLLAALNDTWPALRRDALAAIGLLGDQSALPAVRARLTDAEAIVRYMAHAVLARFGSEDALVALRAGLRNDNWFVRFTVLRGLAVARDPEAVTALMGALDDRDSGVRSAAGQVLGELQAREALPQLLKAVSDQHSHVRWSAAWSLIHVKDGRAIFGLRTALRDNSPDVRAGVLIALAVLSDRDSLSAVRSMLEDRDPMVQVTASIALASLLSSSSVR